MRVVVIAGGLSHERDVSVRSGRRVADALRRAGVDVDVWDFDADVVRRLREQPVDAAFVALHGGSGEDGTVQSVLELAGVPHTGTPAHACRAAYDKAIAKARLVEAGLPTPPWVALPSNAFRDLGASAVSELVASVLGMPMFIKPVAAGSAFGANAVEQSDELAPALVSAFSYGTDALIEQKLPGAEFAVPVLELRGEFVHLDPVLIEPEPGRTYDYQARYDASSGVRYTHLADDSPSYDVPELRRLAVAAHQALGLRGMSRVDIRLDAAGRPAILEAAVTPGLTETSVWPMSVERAGLDTGEVYRDLCEAAVAAGTVPAAQ